MDASVKLRTSWSQHVEGVVWNVAMPDDGSFVAVATGVRSGERIEDLTGELVLFDRRAQTLWRHASATGVQDVATSADGSIIVATVNDHAYAFTREGQILWRHEPPFRIWRVAVSSDGKVIAVASLNQIDVLDRSGRLRWSSKTAGSFWGLSMSNTGRAVAVSSWEWLKEKGSRGETARGVLSMFEESGRLEWEHAVGLQAICRDDVHLVPIMSDDGAIVAFASTSMSECLSVFQRDGRLLWKDSNVEDVVDAAVSSDGSLIVIGVNDFRIHAFDGRNGRMWTRDTGGDPVHLAAADFALAVSRDGSLIAAGSGDEDAYIFDRSGNLLLREHVGVKLQSVKFSADGALLVTGSCAGTIKAIEISSRVDPRKSGSSPHKDL